MIINGECSECYYPLKVDSSKKDITCPFCGCIHDIVTVFRLQPRRNQPANKTYPIKQTRQERRSAELAQILHL